MFIFNQIKNLFIDIQQYFTDAAKKRKISKQASKNVYNDSIKLSKWVYVLFSVIIIFLVIEDHAKKPKLVKEQRIKEIINSKGLDNISEYSLNMELAEEADLPIAYDAYYKTEMAIHEFELSSMLNDDDSVRAVPIFDLADVGREVKYHIVKNNETINQIADKYNLTINTIKWVNQLKNNNLKPGQKLKILPLDGITYKIKSGDTLDKIAEKYKANKERIIVFNDLEVSGIKKDQEIVIPEGVLPVQERPGYMPRRRIVRRYYAPSSSGPFYAIRYNPYPRHRDYSENTAYYGQCTWWVQEYYLRKGDYRMRGKRTGNAIEYSRTLPRLGFKHSSVPIVGAIYQTPYGRTSYGHVAIVSAVKRDASGKIIGYTIEEMNGYRNNWINKRDMKMDGTVNFYY